MNIFFRLFLIYFCAYGSIALGNELYKNEQFFLPLLWATDVNDQFEFEQLSNGQIRHPLTLGRTAFTFLYEGRETKDEKLIAQGLELIQALENYPLKKIDYNSVAYIYPDDYQDFTGGEWWSGMANSSVAAAYLLAYEITENSHFKEQAIQAMNCVIQPVAENGSMINLNDSSDWYLEYVDENRTSDNAYFVHNGFVFSLLVIKYFEETLKNESYTVAYNRGINALKTRVEEYFFEDDRWTFYMTNPRSIESTHYVIYDLILLNSLNQISPDVFFEENIKRRTKAFEEGYPLVIEEGDLFFSLMGSPHFYWQDVYPTALDIYEDGKMINTFYYIPKDFTKRLDKRVMLRIENAEVDSIVLRQIYNNREFKLCSLIPEIADLSKAKIGATMLSANGGIIVEDNVLILKETRATLIYDLTETVDLYNCYAFGWYFNSDVDILSIQIALINDAGESTVRYYVPQEKDKVNLVLLKGMSFLGYDKLVSKNIKQIQVDYFYNEPTRLQEIDYSQLFYFNNPAELKKIFRGYYGGFNFEEKEEAGNIY